MTTPVNENYTVAEEDIHLYPRSSTPIFIPRDLYLPQEKSIHKNGEKSSGYMSWKTSLEREKSSRKFKLRGPETIQSYLVQNCSVISGHIELKLMPDKLVCNKTITRPTPVYHQPWLPVSHPNVWSPALLSNNNNNNNYTNNDHHNHNHYCHYHQNHVCYKTQPLPQLQHFNSAPTPAIPIATNSGYSTAFTNFLNNANQYHYGNLHHNCGNQQHNNYYTTHSDLMKCNHTLLHAMNMPHHPQITAGTLTMRDFYYKYQYLQYYHYYQYQYNQYQYNQYYRYHYPPPTTPYYTYSPGIERTTSYVNVPLHGQNVVPVMMTA